MHDCSKIQEKIVDFVFDELTAVEKSAFAAEINFCADCRGELLAAQQSLQIFAASAESLAPDAAEWQTFEIALLKNFAPKTQPRFVFAKSAGQTLRRFFNSSVRVPSPIFAALLLLFGVAGFFAWRGGANANSQNARISSSAQNAESATRQNEEPVEKIVEVERIIEVERIVEKTVVRNRIVRQKMLIETASANRIASARRNAKIADKKSDQINLAEFKPVGKPAPNVIKISAENEKR